MSYRRRMQNFTMALRVLVFAYIIAMYVFEDTGIAFFTMMPFLISFALFFILFCVLVSRVKEFLLQRFIFSFCTIELFFYAFLIYLTRNSPMAGFDFIYAVPSVTVAIWFGLKLGYTHATIAGLVFVVSASVSSRLHWGTLVQDLLTPLAALYVASWIAGYASETGEMERKEKRRRIVELTTLSNFASMFDATLKEANIINNLREMVDRTLTADVKIVFIPTDDGKFLEIATAEGLADDEMSIKIPLNYGIVGKCLKEGEPILIDNTENEPEFRQILMSRRILSAVYSPLKWRGKVMGVVTVGSSKKSQFNQYDLNLLSALCLQAALTIHNARLYGDLENRVSELQAIFEIDRAITSSLDLRTVLEQIVHIAIGLLDAKIASLMLIDDQAGELKIAAAHGLSRDYVQKGTVMLGESIAGKVALEGKPLAVQDIIKDGRFKFPDYAKKEGLKSLLSVPLMLKDRAIGVLNLYTEDEHEFSTHEINLFTSLASQAAIAIENAQLFESLEEIYIDVITALASAIDARDSYTHGHSHRVTEYAVAIAEEMGLTQKDIDLVRNASILHDVGKIGVNENVLQKPGRLTEEEREIMELHPIIGTKILQPVKLLEPVLPLVYHHQEKFNGAGYPEGLKGEQIPLGARVIAVADAFEAMTSDRPYRKALPIEKAIAELIRERGKQFDPDCVDAFIRVLKRGIIVTDDVFSSDILMQDYTNITTSEN